MQAEEWLDETLLQAFDVGANQNNCWIKGRQETISHVTDFNAKLSDVCDEVYRLGLILWNELINHEKAMAKKEKETHSRLLADVLASVLDEEDDDLPCLACHL